MPLRLILSDSASGRDYVVAVVGPLDASTSRELRNRLAKPVPGFRVVLDLSSASPIADGCIELIANTSRQLIAEGHPVRVVVPDQLAADAVEAAGVQDVVVDRRNEQRLAADVVVPDDLAAQKLAAGS